MKKKTKMETAKEILTNIATILLLIAATLGILWLIKFLIGGLI